ncbi:LOW QUALITY PROTEIN: hypothetical protein Cgig2_028204 [Carnegiea gigantea]|uniref:Aminotransferase-like plant mobile domain-containing protein n=1 Tax=Carnegiea gigantea TaxID=171969 RepID=A0A9Q1GXI4_9CARY|nr:LOW QUALITY PROTEIN: hypothetical protein Cgig2_028204 [Carnegiea gigantea]
MDGTLGNERTPLQNGRECDYGPYYRSLQSLNVIPSSTLTSILVEKVRVKQGTLRSRRNDEKKCVDVSEDYENYFNATVLEKVNTKHRGQETYLADEEFYPTLYRLLTGRSNWGLTFQFRGCSTVIIRVSIFGVVGVSQFLYHFDTNVWWGFCELWGPLTNSFHRSAGELGISLHDLERIGGSLTLRATYEEFLILNKDLAYHNKYLVVVVKLLCIHAELYEFHELDHFYRKYLVYFVYREQTDSEKEKFAIKKRSPIHVSRQERMANLSVITEGELVTFLAFWLIRFILPYGKDVIRP